MSYNPAEAILFDRAHAEGKAPMLDWNEVCPQTAGASGAPITTTTRGQDLGNVRPAPIHHPGERAAVPHRADP
jgi:hypothetical protein